MAERSGVNTHQEFNRRGFNLRRGFLRLAMGLAALWFVFWTCGYIFRPQLSENSPFLAGPAFSLTTVVALAAAAFICLWWIISGLRSN